MKTLAQLKRDLVVGTPVTMVTFEGREPSEKVRGTRYVVRVQSNGVYLNHDKAASGGSFFDFPKASETHYHDDGLLEVNDVVPRTYKVG